MMWRNRRRRSTEAFRAIENHILPEIGGGVLVPIEELEEEKWAQWLDAHAGADFMQVAEDGKSRFLSVRTQPSSPWPFPTMTVRLRVKYNGDNTEFKKRLEAISGGWQYPFYQVHVYYSSDGPSKSLVRAYIAPTEQVIKLLKRLSSDSDLGARNFPHDRSKGWGIGTNSLDGNQFYYITEDCMLRNGVELIRLDGRREVSTPRQEVIPF